MTGLYSEVESPAQSKQSIFRLCTFNVSGVSFLNFNDLGASLFCKEVSIFILLKDQVVNKFTGVMYEVSLDRL